MPIPRKKTTSKKNSLTLPDGTELVGLVFDVVPVGNPTLFPEYAIALHAWFLDQVRQTNPDLSAYLHDGESEKPFTISRLEGELLTAGKQLQLKEDTTYHWYVTALSSSVVEWMQKWLKNIPKTIELRQAPLQIKKIAIAHPPTTYAQLLTIPSKNTVTLSFISPTSFRRKGHHFPLPLPFNAFHSYLRRWNDFSGKPVDMDDFLLWIDENVIIHRHQLTSVKVTGGKKGTVTGFTGAIEYGLGREASETQEFVQLFKALGQLAPYSGTGHKTTFGLGQTRLGWLETAAEIEIPVPEIQLEQRITQLTEMLMAKQKRTGGDRAISVCETRATILARREMGESLQDIAKDLKMPYETVKTYAKLARKTLGN
ncbi:MAG: CRISPR-associated endoribonuclease Cas6 [Scytonema sp. PMC 1069.18]|nr:CRISPR-associated endoribonuclease Cas6 [Scytonema sp. PMC 1069.18]MEC4882972.1 CRISPR-associated endoribonuclease Cas6 [Scytonema sp. PMC 1070.18]